MQCFGACFGDRFVCRGSFCPRPAWWIRFLAKRLLRRALVHVKSPILIERLFGFFARGWLRFSIRGLFRAVVSVADSFDSRRIDITAWKNLASEKGIRMVV